MNTLSFQAVELKPACFTTIFNRVVELVQESITINQALKLTGHSRKWFNDEMTVQQKLEIEMYEVSYSKTKRGEEFHETFDNYFD